MKLPNSFTKDNVIVIADFDRTISYGEQYSPSCYGIMSSHPDAEQEFVERRKEQFEYYRAIELDGTVPAGEKEMLMKKWRTESTELIMEYVDQEYFEKLQTYAAKNIHIRDGFPEFSKNLEALNIPFLVYSAGIKNILDPVLEYNDMYYTDSHANTLGFDMKGKCIGLENIPSLHSGNKTWDTIPEKMKQLATRTRDKIIIIGDSISDIKMAPKGAETFSLGFLLSVQKKQIGASEKFYKSYDHIVESDTGDNGVLEELIRQIDNT